VPILSKGTTMYTAVLEHNTRFHGGAEKALMRAVTKQNKEFRDHVWVDEALISSYRPRNGWEAHISFKAEEFTYGGSYGEEKVSLTMIHVTSCKYVRKPKKKATNKSYKTASTRNVMKLFDMIKNYDYSSSFFFLY
jgi:hypothetical protein